MVHLRFEVDGEVQMSRFFDQAADTIDDFTDIFEAWGDDFRETQHAVFAGEGAYEGRTKWAELSPKYKEWKEQYYPFEPILVLTGAMRAGLTDKSDLHHEHRYTKEEMEIGVVGLGYPMFHQRGTVKMPQRKVIELTQPQKLRWVQIARRAIWEALEAIAEHERIDRAFGGRLGREP